MEISIKRSSAAGICVAILCGAAIVGNASPAAASNIRGTHVHLVNQSHDSLTEKMNTFGQDPVQRQSATLVYTGSADLWNGRGESLTGVWGDLEFSDGHKLNFLARNDDRAESFFVGSPNTSGWIHSEDYDQNESQTISAEGHTLRVTRGADTPDDKNWTVEVVH